MSLKVQTSLLLWPFFKGIRGAVQQQLLDLGRRHARAMLPASSFRFCNSAGDTVAIAHPELVRMGRAQAVAAVMIDGCTGPNWHEYL
jgi:hypothetical protein